MKNRLFKTTGLLAGSIASLMMMTSSAVSGDFSEGSKAREWGLTEEVKATFSGKVVDIMCELSGNCSDNCGNGDKHLGIVRSADDKLILVLKNRQAAFNGATEDLLPYCNKTVDVDGVLIADEEEYGAQFYMIQFIRVSGEEKWNKTNRWTKQWAKKNPDVAKGKGPWFRRDPRVVAAIEKDGRFGLGHEADDEYRKENFE